MIRMIAACARNRVMGRKGGLPWKIREDWDYFLNTTLEGAMIMGRRCYEDFLDHAPNRMIVVLTRDSSKRFAHAEKANCLDEAIVKAKRLAKDVWICGGEEIYREAMYLAEELYLTQIDAEFCGDAYFPDWQEHFPCEKSRRESVCGGYRLSFSVLSKEPSGRKA